MSLIGDFGLVPPSPVYGWNVAQLDFLPVAVDDAGALVTTGGGGGGGGGLTNTELRAAPLEVDVVSMTGGGLTDAELRASAVPMSLASVPSHPVTNAGTFAVQVTSAPSTAVTGPLTDAQLRAVAVPVSGTFFQATQPVSLASVPTHGVTGTFWQATQPVSGTFWQATQPVSGTVNPATAFGKTITYVPVNQGAAGTTQLAAASASNKHKVVAVLLTLSVEGTLKFTDTSGDLTGAMNLAAMGGFVAGGGLVPITETAAVNRAISIVTTGGAARGVVALLTEP
jgi:hypothetical protein